MKRVVSVLMIAMLCPLAASRAQLRTPNDAGVSMGHWHLTVRDLEASKKFWTSIGGTPIKVDGMEAIKFPGVFVFLTPGSPAGDSGNKGAALEHVGFNVRNGAEIMAKLEAIGGRVKREPELGPDNGDVYTHDDLMVEILGRPYDREKRAIIGFAGRDLNVPVASDHLHFFVPDVPQAQAWYAKTFGAREVGEVNPRRGPAQVWDIPGARLRFAKSPTPPLTTRGRALDHLGFEVRDLESFCKKLEASGVKFDQPFSRTRHKSFASAELTDPWGTAIELTEGLNRF